MTKPFNRGNETGGFGLDVSDLADNPSQVRIRRKGDVERIIPLPTAVANEIAAYLETRGDDPGPLLLNQAGNRLGVTSCRRLFDRVLERANLNDADYTPHTLRHAYATMLVRTGADVGVVRDLLAHGSIETMSGYPHSAVVSERAAVDELPFGDDGGAVDGK